jgi:hypothetical protein
MSLRVTAIIGSAIVELELCGCEGGEGERRNIFQVVVFALSPGVPRSTRRRRRRSHRASLSIEARFRGPLVAQTSVRRLAQPRGAGSAPMRKVPANEAVRRRSSSDVAAPDSACHAGGRRFESRRSRKSPAKSAVSVDCSGVVDRRLLSMPRRSRTRIPARKRRSPQIPAGVEPVESAGGLGG